MSLSFFNSVLEFARKHFLPVVLGTFILGGAIAFFAADRRLNTGCVLAMDNSSKNESKKDTRITVDLSGAIVKPGIFQMGEGARVGDLLTLGGGASGEASAKWISKNLNLSEKLEDSSKVYIPFEWEIYAPESYDISTVVKPEDVKKSSSSSSSSSSSGSGSSSNSSSGGSSSSGNSSENSTKINVNEATSDELDELPGIGPAFAERIISNRPYKDFSEFKTKSGLYKSTAEAIKELIEF